MRLLHPGFDASRNRRAIDNRELLNCSINGTCHCRDNIGHRGMVLSAEGKKRRSSLMETTRSIVVSLEIYVFAHVAGVSKSGVGCRTTISI
jgi:hypothetical protein